MPPHTPSSAAELFLDWRLTELGRGAGSHSALSPPFALPKQQGSPGGSCNRTKKSKAANLTRSTFKYCRNVACSPLLFLESIPNTYTLPRHSLAPPLRIPSISHHPFLQGVFYAPSAPLPSALPDHTSLAVSLSPRAASRIPTSADTAEEASLGEGLLA